LAFAVNVAIHFNVWPKIVFKVLFQLSCTHGEDRKSREISLSSCKIKERTRQKLNVAAVSGTQAPCPFERKNKGSREFLV